MTIGMRRRFALLEESQMRAFIPARSGEADCCDSYTKAAGRQGLELPVNFTSTHRP